MHISIDILQNQYNVTEIHLGHRKTNTAAAKLYEQLGFQIVGEDAQDYFRVKVLKFLGVSFVSDLMEELMVNFKKYFNSISVLRTERYMRYDV